MSEEHRTNETAPSDGYKYVTWALLGLVAMFGIAFLLILFIFLTRPEPTEPTPTAIAEETQEPEPPPEPQITPIPNDPRDVLGDPEGVEKFGNNANWDNQDTRCFSSKITDAGHFRMTAKGGEMQHKPCTQVTWAEASNFYLETTVIMPEKCETSDRFGLFIRTPDLVEGYLVGLTCDGRMSLYKWDGQNEKILIDPVASEHINKGAGETNRMGVLAKGSDLLLYANGHFMGQKTNKAFDGGRFGYFVRANTAEGFTVAYDEMSIWLLDE